MLFPRTSARREPRRPHGRCRGRRGRDELRLVCGVRTTEDVASAGASFPGCGRRSARRGGQGDPVERALFVAADRAVGIERLHRMPRSMFDSITVVAYVRPRRAAHQPVFVRACIGENGKLTLQAEEGRRPYMTIGRCWPTGRPSSGAKTSSSGDIGAGCSPATQSMISAPWPASTRRMDRASSDRGGRTSLDATACEFLRLFNTAMPRFIAGKGMIPCAATSRTMLAEMSRGPVQSSTRPSSPLSWRASAPPTRVWPRSSSAASSTIPRILFGGPDGGRPRTREPDLTLERAIGIFARLWERKQGEVLQPAARRVGPAARWPASDRSLQG